ncbi:MAG: MBL fold metallo-hydrolase, partial [Oscillospiraceae bacterium]
PVPVYASEATLNALRYMDAVQPDTQLVAIGSTPMNILGFTVYGFATSHDSAGCCGFHITTPSGATMAIATDLGVITQEVFSHLQSAQLVALEANYDIEQLRMGPYPYYLKKRISSSRGHLSNDDSAAAIARLIANGCRRVALCHLSQENNHPNLVLNSLDSALFSEGVQLPEDCVIQISRRYQTSPWIHF